MGKKKYESYLGKFKFPTLDELSLMMAKHPVSLTIPIPGMAPLDNPFLLLPSNTNPLWPDLYLVTCS